MSSTPVHTTRALAVLAAVGIGLASAAGPSGASVAVPAVASSLLERAFQIRAEAYPTEPAPGSSSEAIAIRPHSTLAEVANPPANAYARAVQTDLGLAESYFGRVGPRAEADTSVEGGADDVTVTESGTTLHVVVTAEPTSEATAVGEGADSSSGSSRSFGGLVDDALVAEASAELQDALVGPLFVGQGTYVATARVDGTLEGASGTGTITLSETSVDGVPVVVGPGGVRVDETEVPAAALGLATAQIQEYFSQGGYADVRLVQPKVVVSDDGSSVEVSGGGVFLYFTNNDPTSKYFLQYTLLGGRVAVNLGADLATIGPPLTLPPSTTPPTTASPTVPSLPRDTPDSGPVTTVTSPAPVTVDDAVEVAYVDGDQTLELRGIWAGWPLVVGGAGLAAVASALGLRMDAVRRRVDALVDGYLRG